MTRQVDGSGGAARDFWRELDRLRRQQGMSYQRLARRTAVPHSTLQHWLMRRHQLASWAEIQPIVAALGGSEPEWFQRWQETAVTGESERDAERVSASLTMTAQAQLPMDIMEFTGRDEETRLLLSLLDVRTRTGTAVPIAAIEGMAGVGKTRLAVHVAHHLVERGSADEVQLYVDLGSHSPRQQPAHPAAVLEDILRLLGVTGDQIPQGLHQRAALYRAMLHGKRAVVVLDNVASEDQVRPLLPGSPTSSVITTSRRKLAGLDGARPVTLGVFNIDDALMLLANITGEQRVHADPGMAREIVKHCGCLPLAVALVARRLQARPTWPFADLVRRLRQQDLRLAELTISDRAVVSAFAVSYDHLPTVQRRVFRLLALHPGTDFTAASVAALTAIPTDTAETLLEALLDEHLLEQTTYSRYRFHDLVHTFARDRVLAEEPEDSRNTAIRGLLSWYVHTAERAEHMLGPHRRRMPLPPLDCTAHPLEFVGDRDALHWFVAERNNLLAAIDSAMEHEWYDLAWRLPALMYVYFTLRQHWDAWIDSHNKVLVACRRLADHTAEAWILNGLGIAHAAGGRPTEALEYLHRSLALCRRLGDHQGQGQVLNNIGETYRRLGQLSDAIDHYREDLAICRELRDHHGEAISLNNIGKALYAGDNFTEALLNHQKALALRAELGDRVSASETLHDLGDTYRSLNELELAAEYYERALAVRQDIGDLHGEAQSWYSLGEIHEARGADDSAQTCFRKAHIIRQTLANNPTDALASSSARPPGQLRKRVGQQVEPLIDCPGD